MPVNTIEPRISSLEADVRNLSNDVRTIASAVDSLRTTISESQRPQWANLIAAVALSVVIIGAIGAAFVAPIQIGLASVAKTQGERSVVLEDLRERTRIIAADLLAETKANEIRHTSLAKEIGIIRDQGSPITRERLAVLEQLVRANQNRSP